MSRLNKQNITRGISYLKRNGVVSSVYKALERLERDEAENDYETKRLNDVASDEELANQRKVRFKNPYKISILIPVYETDNELLKRTLESVLVQSYGNWEICIADASSDSTRRVLVRDFCEEMSKKYTDEYGNTFDKIKYKHLSENRGISANTNEALEMASGDYIALLDHDDIIEPDALYSFMKCVSERETTLEGGELSLSRVYMVYTDEDKVDEREKRYFDYHKKPDFDPILLCTNNYICHFLFVDTNLAKSVGGFHSEYDGAQDHDFVLRCSEGIEASQIAHIGKVLYHWRSTTSSTAENPNAKLYAYEAGLRAVRDHLTRIGIKATVSHTEHLGFYQVIYESYHKSVYAISYEKFLEMSDAQIRLITQEYLMILSDTLKPCDASYVERMISCMRYENVGAVTGKIISKSGRVESAGYDKIENGEPMARFSGLNRHYSGYLHRANLAQTVDTFNAECVLVRMSAAKVAKGEIELLSGYSVYYEPAAVFKRRIL